MMWKINSLFLLRQNLIFAGRFPGLLVLTWDFKTNGSGFFQENFGKKKEKGDLSASNDAYTLERNLFGHRMRYRSEGDRLLGYSFRNNPQPSFPPTRLPNKCPATSLDTEQTRQNKPIVRTNPNFDLTTGFPALTTTRKSRISGDEGRVPSFRSVGNSPFAAL
ncbi:hypothetical protein TNCV_4653371 [Trichonephila clavipes]|nr:hypothetical protein TNCV_4653371 [Trichonephila clavipes]